MGVWTIATLYCEARRRQMNARHSSVEFVNVVKLCLMLDTWRKVNITPVLVELHCLPIEYRIQFKIAVTIFKVLMQHTNRLNWPTSFDFTFHLATCYPVAKICCRTRDRNSLSSTKLFTTPHLQYGTVNNNT
jgi:hypothetical protein